MPAATDPPPPLKPSRYRTIRGKNVPESRRFVEPTATPNGAGVQTAALTNSISTNSNGTATSSGSGSRSGYSDLSSRQPTPAAPSVAVFHNNDVPRPPLPALASGNGNGAGLNGSQNMADAVRHAPPAPLGPQQQYQQQQQQLSGSTATISAASSSPAERPRHRSPPLRPTRLDTTPPASAPAPASAPILVPLPSARARGMVSGADQHEMLLAGGITLDADEVARRDAEAERLLAEQKRKDLERLERELENHQSAASNLPPKSPSREKFSFLSRRRGLSSAAPPTPTATTFTTSTEPLPTSPISPNGASSSRPTTSYTSSRAHSGSEPPLPLSAATTATTASSITFPQQMDVPSSAPGSGANRVSSPAPSFWKQHRLTPPVHHCPLQAVLRQRSHHAGDDSG